MQIVEEIRCGCGYVLLGEEEDNPLEDQIADPNMDAAAAAFLTYERELLETTLTGLPEPQARVIRSITSACSAPPSSLTASIEPSETIRTAFLTASSTPAW